MSKPLTREEQLSAAEKRLAVLFDEHLAQFSPAQAARLVRNALRNARARRQYRPGLSVHPDDCKCAECGYDF